MEKFYEYDRDVFMIFVEFKQVYDSISRTTTKAMDKLIEFSHRINLTINEERKKYIQITRRSVNKIELKVGPYSFERVDEFKYLGVNINTKK